MSADKVHEIAVLADDDRACLPRGIEYFAVCSIPYARIAQGKSLDAVSVRLPGRQQRSFSGG